MFKYTEGASKWLCQILLHVAFMRLATPTGQWQWQQSLHAAPLTRLLDNRRRKTFNCCLIWTEVVQCLMKEHSQNCWQIKVEREEILDLWGRTQIYQKLGLWISSQFWVKHMWRNPGSTIWYETHTSLVITMRTVSFVDLPFGWVSSPRSEPANGHMFMGQKSFLFWFPSCHFVVAEFPKRLSPAQWLAWSSMILNFALSTFCTGCSYAVRLCVPRVRCCEE